MGADVNAQLPAEVGDIAGNQTYKPIVECRKLQRELAEAVMLFLAEWGCNVLNTRETPTSVGRALDWGRIRNAREMLSAVGGKRKRKKRKTKDEREKMKRKRSSKKDEDKGEGSVQGADRSKSCLLYTSDAADE